MKFKHPEPKARKNRIFPVFIPFAGCKTRCVFCAQEAQSGSSFKSIAETLSRTRAAFALRTPGRPVELAFYGGTFTALPEAEQQACLELAAELKEQGLVSALRCSTRPDAVDEATLARLRAAGLDLVELGVQSFADAPLAASRRGYTGKTALSACRMVRESGLGLGIQLMPGMPGMTEAHFRRDAELCAALAPKTARLYPCLVLEGTPLAETWRKGGFTPWSLDLVLELLPEALLLLWTAGVRVIRMGLAPEPSLEPGILAGPLHPALGQMLRAKAFYLHVTRHVLSCGPNARPFALFAPARYQGEIFGHRNSLLPDWEQAGLDSDAVTWWDSEHFEIHYH